MYRRYAIKFHKTQVEFIDCVNMLERIKKARALPSGALHLGVKRCTVSSSGVGGAVQVTIKDCV